MRFTKVRRKCFASQRVADNHAKEKEYYRDFHYVLLSGSVGSNPTRLHRHLNIEWIILETCATKFGWSRIPRIAATNPREWKPVTVVAITSGTAGAAVVPVGTTLVGGLITRNFYWLKTDTMTYVVSCIPGSISYKCPNVKIGDSYKMDNARSILAVGLFDLIT
jgi:hypothetical protein